MSHDPVVRVLLYVATGILIFLLSISIWFAFNNDTEASINQRLDGIESTLRYNSCLLLFEPSERNEVVITDCQSDPPTRGE